MPQVLVLVGVQGLTTAVVRLFLSGLQSVSTRDRSRLALVSCTGPG